jgi:DNA-binding CsgD family transcriptional regulator
VTTPTPLERAAELVVAGQSYRSAAATVGISDKTLRVHMRAAGTAPQRRRGGRPAAELDPSIVLALHAEGRTQREIAAHLNASVQAVVTALDRAGVSRMTRHAPTRRDLTVREAARLRKLFETWDHPTRPSNDRLLRLAQRLAADGVPMSRLSAALGVHRKWAWARLERAGMLPEPHEANARL